MKKMVVSKVWKWLEEFIITNELLVNTSEETEPPKNQANKLINYTL